MESLSLEQAGPSGSVRLRRLRGSYASRQLPSPVLGSNYLIRVAITCGIYICCLSVSTSWSGFCGLLDLGYVAFYAIGAYTYAFLASPHFGIHLPWLAVLPFCALVPAFFGVLLGTPTLRLRGDYLAIVTLGFGEIVRLFINNMDSVTNGPKGIANIDTVTIFGVEYPHPHPLLLPGAGLRAGVRRGHQPAGQLARRAGPGEPSARTRWPPKPWA